MPKLLLVCRQTRSHLGCIRRTPRQDAVLRNDPALRLAQQDFPAILGLCPRFIPSDDGGLGFKETHDLLAGWYLLAGQTPSASRALSLGWWIGVSMTVVSSRSARPRVSPAALAWRTTI
jgi:hypothetical protein